MPSDISLDLAVSLAASVVWVLLALFAKEVVVPWVDNLLYKGPTVAGEWHDWGDSERPTDSPAGHVVITQKGRSVRMVLQLHRGRTGNPSTRTFVYSGRFDAGQLTVLFDQKGAEGFISGAMALLLSADGKRLLGKTVFADRDINQVVSHTVHFTRK